MKLASIILFVILVLFVGIVLDKRYSKESKRKDIPPRLPCEPFCTKPVAFASDKAIPVNVFGPMYNLTNRHIKKYKRNVKKK